MDEQIFTASQIEFFTQTLHSAFIKYGFEVIEEPYIDCSLFGFRATYIRRYIGHKPSQLDNQWTTVIQVVGLPFGFNKQKMVIMSTPKTLSNETISEALKLRVHFDDSARPYIVYAEQNNRQANNKLNKISAEHSTSISTPNRIDIDLTKYVAYIIETISPGLIMLPVEMKIEILKRLSVESIIRMSQVNNEFKWLIFKQGEGLWRHLCKRDFNVTRLNRSIQKNWKELYKDLYIAYQVEMCRKNRALTAAPELLALPPVPGRLPIEWPLHALAMPLYPFPDPLHPIALGFIPRSRSDSVGSMM